MTNAWPSPPFFPIARVLAPCILHSLASGGCGTTDEATSDALAVAGASTAAGAQSGGGAGAQSGAGAGAQGGAGAGASSAAGAQSGAGAGASSAAGAQSGAGAGASSAAGAQSGAGAGSGGGGLGDAGAGGGGGDAVVRTASTFTFQHFPIETNDEGVWNGASSPAVAAVSTTFDTVVLENGYLRVTLLPEYGGRVLSIVHKPTGHELLYQNAVGTPYLMYEDIFYYDYLMILGGIFPSFPEPEHGRYWNQPYNFEVVSESEEAVTVRMSRQDDRDVVDGVPDVYTVGRTDVLVEVDVTLRAGRSNLEFETRLTNTRSTAVEQFEYWTVTTLAPGSAPGQSAVSLNAKIAAQMEQVHLLESSWSWFGDAEERVSDEVFRWNNLATFANWVDQGTAFANPSYEANWSGLINYDNDIGILRVSDNVETPGLKLWTFGKGSLEVDLSDSDEWLRPTIEMWHGVTPEFWDRTSMAAGEVRQWSESYFPTLGLREVTAASKHGALYLSEAKSDASTVLTVDATLTLPSQSVTAILRLGDRVVAEQDVVVAPSGATTVSASVASAEISPGAIFEAEFLLDNSRLLFGQIALP